LHAAAFSIAISSTVELEALRHRGPSSEEAHAVARPAQHGVAQFMRQSRDARHVDPDQVAPPRPMAPAMTALSRSSTA
jgi:hypothetical protein